MAIKLKIFLFSFFSVAICMNALGQTDSSSTQLFKAPVQDILNLPVKVQSKNEIISASKKAEDIFEAPIAASVITREDIQKAGALSIAEALRLLPGVLVRETSNGNYDVNIRGFNNTPPGSDLYVADNSNSLVMINNRPVFNYFSGGTFWEALPIEINDIERIELIRGVSSALYGSNALTGVINIITRKITKEGFFSSAVLEAGNYNMSRAQASLGYSPSSKFEFITSFNFTQKNRTMDELYSFKGQKYVDLLNDSLINYQSGVVLTGNTDFVRKFPLKSSSMNRYGINAWLSYKPNTFLSFDLNIGHENSYSVRPFAENGYTPYSSMYSQTTYLDLKTQVKDGTVQLSYLFGNQKPGLESLGANFDLNVLDVQSDYNFNWKNLNIRPGISYKSIVYDDSKYFNPTDLSKESGVLNGKKKIQILSPSLRLDYQLGNLRIIAAARLENYFIKDAGNIFGKNKADNVLTYLAYQFAGTYQIKERHLIRLSYGQANRGAFLTDFFSNYRGLANPSGIPGVSLQTLAIGNPNLKLKTARTLEFGYRFKWNTQLSIDLEVFQSDASDYTSLILSIDTIINNTGVILNPTFTQSNIQAKVVQRAMTLGINYSPFASLQANFFATVQETDIFDFSPYNVLPELDPTGQRNYLIYSNLKDYKGTPKVYGGFSMNYSFSKFNLNLNGYFFTSQELTHLSDISLKRPPTIAKVEDKFLLNFKFSYQPVKPFKAYINARNLFGQTGYEYIFTDKTGTIFSGGVQYDF